MNASLRRRTLLSGLAAACAPAWATHGYEHSLRIIVPQAPGGASDTLARGIAEGLVQVLGRPVRVENRAGGGTVQGTLALAQAAPDGNTLGLVLSTLAINQALRPRVPYDAFSDFEPVCLGGHSVLVLVADTALPAQNMAELLALARRSTVPLQYASLGTGSSAHLAGELLQLRTGIQLQHVPYNGSGQVYQALMGGQIPLGFVALESALPHVASGRLRLLGMTNRRRVAAFPQLPAIAETVPGFEVIGFFGFMAPAQTPPALVNALYEALARTFNTPALKKHLAAQAVVLTVQGPAQFGAFLREQVAQYTALAQRTGVRLE
jgi:tripartite-type tricarboxylate transporter receptor subunit TctC